MIFRDLGIGDLTSHFGILLGRGAITLPGSIYKVTIRIYEMIRSVQVGYLLTRPDSSSVVDSLKMSSARQQFTMERRVKKQ